MFHVKQSPLPHMPEGGSLQYSGPGFVLQWPA